MAKSLSVYIIMQEPAVKDKSEVRNIPRLTQMKLL